MEKPGEEHVGVWAPCHINHDRIFILPDPLVHLAMLDDFQLDLDFYGGQLIAQALVVDQVMAAFRRD